MKLRELIDEAATMVTDERSLTYRQSWAISDRLLLAALIAASLGGDHDRVRMLTTWFPRLKAPFWRWVDDRCLAAELKEPAAPGENDAQETRDESRILDAADDRGLE